MQLQKIFVLSIIVFIGEEFNALGPGNLGLSRKFNLQEDFNLATKRNDLQGKTVMKAILCMIHSGGKVSKKKCLFKLQIAKEPGRNLRQRFFFKAGHGK